MDAEKEGRGGGSRGLGKALEKACCLMWEPLPRNEDEAKT